MKFLRPADIIARRGGGMTRFYGDIKKGLWPALVRHGPRCSVQPEAEVDLMLAHIASGASDAELRELVCSIVAARQLKAAQARALNLATDALAS
jgi:hypothetical protein